MNINFIFFLAWISTSFLLTTFLKNKVALFKKIGTSINFFGSSIICLFLHKIVSDLLNMQEISFLFLSVFLFGIALSLLILERTKKKRKKTDEEIIQIQKISAQSQVNNYNKNKSKK